MANPYESPSTESPPYERDNRVLAALVPFAFAAPCIAVLVWLQHAEFAESRVAATLHATLITVLIFDIPVCIWVAIEWSLTGRPPDLSLTLLDPQELAFRRMLRERPTLDDDQFHEAYYADTQIPKHLCVKLRQVLGCEFGVDFSSLDPADVVTEADHDVDGADIIALVVEEFGVELDRGFFREWDGTFDGLLQAIAERYPEQSE